LGVATFFVVDKISDVFSFTYILKSNYIGIGLFIFLFAVALFKKFNEEYYEYQKKLIEINQSLEQEVAKQTAQLKEKNENLEALNKELSAQKEILEKTNTELLDAKKKQEEDFENYITSFFKTRTTLIEMIETGTINKEDLIKGIDIIFSSNFVLDREQIMKDFNLNDNYMNVLYEMLFCETNKEIASRVHLEENTVGVYKKRVKETIQAYSKGEIIAKLLKYIKK